jgi:hypothetical protein
MDESHPVSAQFDISRLTTDEKASHYARPAAIDAGEW